MTRQTAEPLPDYRLSASNRTASEIANTMLSDLDLNPPYQRGSVWTADQRIALVKSWVMGVPVPSIMLNNRANEEWRVNEGDGAWMGRSHVWAVVDGKQRILTAVAWFGGKLAVPASWFPADAVAKAKQTSDGPYVTFSGLTRPAQLHMKRTAMLPITEAKLPSMQAEAELFLLVNGGGTAQTADDMRRATRVAKGAAR